MLIKTHSLRPHCLSCWTAYIYFKMIHGPYNVKISHLLRFKPSGHSQNCQYLKKARLITVLTTPRVLQETSLFITPFNPVVSQLYIFTYCTVGDSAGMHKFYKILGSRRLTRSEFHIEHPRRGTTAQTAASWCDRSRGICEPLSTVGLRNV